MKEMEYSCSKKREVLDSGKCCNYNYYILNLGAFPTAYIEIPKIHKLYLKHYNNIDIDVHGGLTYSNKFLWISDTEEIKNSWFIGWDYGHYDDYIGYEQMYSLDLQTDGKKWPTSEIREEVLNVCNQLERLNHG